MSDERDLIPLPRGMSPGFYAFMGAGQSANESGELMMFGPAKKPFPVNRSRIASRVRGREAAGELLSLLDADVREDANAMEVIVETLECFTNRNKPTAPVEVEPIARLGATPIPFGQHCGKDFDSVPLDYLDWLCREQEGFYKMLRSYLKHPELESRRRGL